MDDEGSVLAGERVVRGTVALGDRSPAVLVRFCGPASPTEPPRSLRVAREEEFGIEIPETATVIEVQQVFNIAEELMKSNLHLKAFSKQSKQDQKTKEKLVEESN